MVACASAGRVTFNSRMTLSSSYGNGSCGNNARYYPGSLIHAMWAKIKTLIFHRYNIIYKSYHKTSIFPVALKTGMPSSLPPYPPACCPSSCEKQGHPHKAGRHLASTPLKQQGACRVLLVMNTQSAVRAPSPQSHRPRSLWGQLSCVLCLFCSVLFWRKRIFTTVPRFLSHKVSRYLAVGK